MKKNILEDLGSGLTDHFYELLPSYEEAHKLSIKIINLDEQKIMEAIISETKKLDRSSMPPNGIIQGKEYIWFGIYTDNTILNELKLITMDGGTILLNEKDNPVLFENLVNWENARGNYLYAFSMQVSRREPRGSKLYKSRASGIYPEKSYEYYQNIISRSRRLMSKAKRAINNRPTKT